MKLVFASPSLPFQRTRPESSGSSGSEEAGTKEGEGGEEEAAAVVIKKEKKEKKKKKKQKKQSESEVRVQAAILVSKVHVSALHFCLLVHAGRRENS